MTAYPAHARTIGEIPRYWATHTPDAVAFWERDEAITFRTFAGLIDTGYALLAARGVVAGDRVMIVAENCVAEIALFFAASELGAWPILLNARLSEREIETIRAHCRPRLQLFTSIVSQDARAHSQRARARSLDAPFVGIDVTETDTSAASEPQALATKVATLLYTSGTTGAPKGVMLTHSGLLHFAAVSTSSRRLTPADRVYGVLPLSHIFGIATIMLSTLYAGAALYIDPRFDAAAATRVLQRFEITTLQAVPLLWRRLLSYFRTLERAPVFPHLRYLYAGGGGLEPGLKADVESTFGLPLHHGYGMTEYAGSMFITPMERPRKDCSSGELNPGCEVRIVDTDGREVDSDRPGEIWIRGPGTMLGYYNAPQLTSEVLQPDGWMKTGDIGRLENGALFVVARSKEMIKRSGFNVYPIEVESVLNGHPAVKLSAVVGRAADDGNEEVVAFIEIEPGAAFDPAALKEYASARLAPYKRPQEIIAVNALPLNANGKVLKHELKARLQAG